MYVHLNMKLILYLYNAAQNMSKDNEKESRTPLTPLTVGIMTYECI